MTDQLISTLPDELSDNDIDTLLENFRDLVSIQHASFSYVKHVPERLCKMLVVVLLNNIELRPDGIEFSENCIPLVAQLIERCANPSQTKKLYSAIDDAMGTYQITNILYSLATKADSNVTRRQVYELVTDEINMRLAELAKRQSLLDFIGSQADESTEPKLGTTFTAG